MDHNQSLPLALWPEPPAFVYSVPVQMFGMGVVLAFATVMLVNLAFTARYHYPLERVNFLLQLISSFLSFLLTVSSMAATISDLKLRSSADLRRFPYLPITLPSLHWSLAETILFVILQSVSVSATNLEKHLIVLMLGPLVLAQFGLFFLDFVKKPVIRYQDICESTLSLMYLFGLLIWGMLMNRQRAWRKDGATALFGCTTLFLAIARAAASFYHMTDQPAYWVLLLSWALSIWQSWLGFWWWGIGEVEDRLRRQERVRERYSSRKSRKHRSHKIATKRSDPTPTVSQRVSSQQAPTSESTASESSSSNAASASFDRNTPSSSFTSSMTSWNMLQETRKWLRRVLPAALVRRFEQMRYEHQQGVLIAALKQVDIYQKVILRSHPMLRDKPVQ